MDNHASFQGVSLPAYLENSQMTIEISRCRIRRLTAATRDCPPIQNQPASNLGYFALPHLAARLASVLAPIT
jgi:hypothetical protein